MEKTPLDILKKYWKYDAFRSMQEEIIQSVLDGKDTLGLLPTGGGKSICFQVPALLKEGVCIVVSPLIALMKDQVANLKKRNIKAEAIYSGMHYMDIDRILDNCVYGDVKLLYLSPERLKSELAQERIKRMNVNLIAVDEAHCISQWGYDFRPSYLEIKEIRKIVPNTPILALTATATPEVVEDIQDQLEFPEKNVFQKSFNRENLAYVVLKEEGKEAKLLDILRKVPGTGVVYVRNRKLTKETALYLQKNGISADYYHAGLSHKERSAKQEAWQNNQTRVIVSTNAFGMGIDKPDVRTVVHLDLPDSLEAYFQEAGRAGRDGKKSYAVLLYAEADRMTLEWKYKTSFPDMTTVRQVYRALGNYFQLAVGAGEGRSYDFDILEFVKRFQIDILTTFATLRLLEQAGWIVLTDAIFSSSTIKVRVQPEQIYDYMLKNKPLERLIKGMLRALENAFIHHAAFQEKQLARYLKIPVSKLIQQLNHLMKEGLITYTPQKDKPQIIFLKERVAPETLTIDMKGLNFRKKRYKERIDKAIAYAENTICRSQQLLAYFGEKATKPCGVCDVCLGRTKSDISKEDYERYKIKILELLERESLTSEEILHSFAPKRQRRVLAAIQFMLQEGILNKEGEKLRLP